MSSDNNSNKLPLLSLESEVLSGWGVFVVWMKIEELKTCCRGIPKGDIKDEDYQTNWSETIRDDLRCRGRGWLAGAGQKRVEEMRCPMSGLERDGLNTKYLCTVATWVLHLHLHFGLKFLNFQGALFHHLVYNAFWNT